MVGEAHQAGCVFVYGVLSWCEALKIDVRWGRGGLGQAAWACFYKRSFVQNCIRSLLLVDEIPALPSVRFWIGSLLTYLVVVSEPRLELQWLQ